MRLMPYKVAAYYRNIAYLFVIGLVVASAVAPVFGHWQVSGSVSLSITGTSLSTSSTSFRGTTYESSGTATGTVIISGNYLNYSTTPFNETTKTVVTTHGVVVSVSNATASGGGAQGEGVTTINGTTYYTEPAPIYLKGFATFYYENVRTGAYENETVAISDFKNPYYTGESANFSVSWSAPFSQLEFVSITVNAYSYNGYLLATTESAAGQVLNSQMFDQIIALPLFNDQMLGTGTSQPSQGQPTLPLGGLYNLLLIISLIIIAFSFLFVFYVPQNGRRPTAGQALVRIAMGVGIVLLFPLIYDKVAYLLNFMNQMIIAYPNPYQDYASVLSKVYWAMVAPANLSMVTFITTALFSIAYAVVALIVYIMLYLLGTVRIFLVAGMIVMFPLAVALHDIPFTQKLGRMIEDTFFGLVLATVLSAAMLSVAGYLINNWTSADNMFVLAGIPSQWMAAAAIIVAILAPTVLAPLVSTVYQTTSQIAMAGGAVAYAVYSAGLGGVGHGAALAGGFGGGGLDGGGAALSSAGATTASTAQQATTSVVQQAVQNTSWKSRVMAYLTKTGHVAGHGALYSLEAALELTPTALGLGKAGKHSALAVSKLKLTHEDQLRNLFSGGGP